MNKQRYLELQLETDVKSLINDLNAGLHDYHSYQRERNRIANKLIEYVKYKEKNNYDLSTPSFIC